MPKALDQDALAAAKAAVQKYLATQTIWGVNIGAHVTDDELTAATTAAVQAYLNYLAAPSL